MFKTKYVFALIGFLLSFASLDTASYASPFACPDNDTSVENVYINSVKFSSSRFETAFTIENRDDIFYNYLVAENFQPIEISAFLSRTPVHFCYHIESENYFVDRLEITNE
ncbi:hypothetical protein COMNV_00459 [Commensalibacter sp. Nvir]|uniref:hypothetical protein n=1 Tax=Commensalibacter sp. Nvir TaxID=3069817 RepID=UPI002D40BE62|nr:hypothetical protein COMNV_00459 [Commensalibacter sp. Nvir]